MSGIPGCMGALAVSGFAAAALDDITHAEAVRGLRQALIDGSLAAVFRRDPDGATSSIVRKVFGALR